MNPRKYLLEALMGLDMCGSSVYAEYYLQYKKDRLNEQSEVSHFHNGHLSFYEPRLENLEYQNVYVDLKGIVRFRKNPTTGLYWFDGQFFYRKRGSQ